MDGRLSTREEVYARHALAHPASLVRGDGWVAFGVIHPAYQGEDRFAVAAAPGAVATTRHDGSWPIRDGSLALVWRQGADGTEMVTCLGMLGVGRGIGAMPAARDGELPVVALLAGALVEAWKAAGCAGDEDADNFEAREREQARLDAAGLNELLAALPAGIGRILDCHGGFSGERTWSDAFLRYALAREGRSRAVAALGDLMDLVSTGADDEDPADHPDAASFVMECIARWPTEPLASTGSPTTDDAAWLIGRFSDVEPRGDLATAVPRRHLRELLAHRKLVEDHRLRGPADAAGLLDVVLAVSDAGMGHPRLARVLRVLSLCGGEDGYGAIAQDIAEAGGGGRKGFRKGCERLFVDADNLRRAFRNASLFPAAVPHLAASLGTPNDGWRWLGIDNASLGRRSAEAADEAVFGGRSIAEATAAGHAWRQAGSPGLGGLAPDFWQDIGDFGGEAHERLTEAALGKAPDGDPTPFLAEGWRGPGGSARLAAAASDLAEACVRSQPTGNRIAEPSPGDAGNRPGEVPAPAGGSVRRGFLARIAGALRGRG